MVCWFLLILYNFFFGYGFRLRFILTFIIYGDLLYMNFEILGIVLLSSDCMVDC